MTIRSAVALLGLLTLTACGGQVSQLYRDPDFRPDTLRSEGLVVGGVVMADSTTDPDLALDYGADLQNTLAHSREGMKVEGPGTALLAGDVETYRATLEAYRRSARLGADDLENLRPVRGLGRYFLLGRIDIDEVEETHEESRDDQADRVRFDVELITRRHVGVTFDVFDLQEARIVWSASLDRRTQVRGERFSHEAYPEDMQDSAIEELREIRERIRQVGHPEPPRRSEVLRKLYEELDDALFGG